MLSGCHFLLLLLLLFCYEERNMEIKCEHFYRKITHFKGLYHQKWFQHKIMLLAEIGTLKQKLCLYQSPCQQSCQDLFWDFFIFIFLIGESV